jgi:predicted transcriptional regulator
MESPIPSAEEVRSMLDGLTLKQMEDVALRSGVPFSTIYKIKRGETRNPGIETLRQFLPFVKRAREGVALAPTLVEASHAG